MKRRILGLLGCIIILAGTIGAVSPAWSDWNPGDSYKWLQLPDLTGKGVAVRVSSPLTLADDFKCTGTGPITGIHIWAASEGTEPLLLNFTLKIWTNIPVGPNQPYSMPGEQLWEETFSSSQYQYRLYATVDPPEAFFDPTGAYSGNVASVWQYNFFPTNPLVQTEGEIYWLSATFWIDLKIGWQSTDLESRRMDDAVWTTGGIWQPLKYLDGHPYQGESLDLAFVITPIPAALPLLGSGLLGLAVWGYRRRRQ